MAKHQIKNRWNDSVLFECEVPDDMASELRARHALEKAVASGANLAGANMAGANMAGANMAGAYLPSANMAGANMADANMAGAYLADANMAGANMAGAYLPGANMAGANMTGAKWRDGIVINKHPIQLFGLHWRVTILDAHMQIGCELHTLADWAAYDDARIAQMDGREALRFWRAHKDVLLGLAKSAGRGVDEVKEPA